LSYFDIIALLLLVTACAGFINHRWLRLPSAIGLLIIALVLSLCIALVGHLAEALALRPDIAQTLTDVNLRQLREHAGTVLALATVGVLISTALYGGAMWWLSRLTGTNVPLSWCLVLGAILAPTDPIAVTGLLREAGLPQSLLAVITGESLFNDGVAVVVFTVLLDIAAGEGGRPGWLQPALVFLRESGGGAVVGLAAGWLAFGAMRLVDDYNLELTITLALVTVTYSLANQLGLSGPIAVVVAGVVIGNIAARRAMSETTRANVTLFWALIDELLNALLFLVVGLETLTIDTSRFWPYLMAGGIVLAVLVRLISAGLPAALLNLRRLHQWRGVAVLTWGGLRGGISVALALSLPDGPNRAPLLQVCYAVVVFTIVVQGLTMPPLVRRLYGAAVRAPARHDGQQRTHGGGTA